MVGTLLVAALPVASPAAAAPGDDAPLAVTMETLTPSVIPQRGRVEVSGVVTNESDQTWTDLQVYLLTSDIPIRSRAGLAAAADTDPRLEVGDRLAGAGQFVEIGDLGPGESTAYSLSMPRRDLEITGEPGAYWVGVHVLGTVEGVRDVAADGRARTFMPLMRPRGPETELALVVPFRSPVRHTPESRLLEHEGWQEKLGEGGRMSNLVELAAASDGPLTMVVDPAVLDAAASVAADNPPLSTADDGSGPETDAGDEASTSPSAVPEEDGEEEAEPTEAALVAASWLEEFTTTAASSTVLAVPYGDLDVASATSEGMNGLVRRATRLSGDTMDAAEINSAPVVAPPSGFLPSRAFAAVEEDTPVLLSDRAVPGASGSVVPGPGGTDIVLTDTEASSGGPGPNPRRSVLAMRQRILADAALHALSGGGDPLVVSLPQGWDPGADWERADFFGGLDVPWLSRTDVPAVVADASATVSDGEPRHPRRLRRQQLPLANLAATRGLVRAGEVFAELLTRNDTVAVELAKTAMLASSCSARSRPDAAAERVRETTLRVRRTMQRVEVEGPPFVMMSGGTGPLAVTVVNNLDEAVTVELEAQTGGDDLTIDTPEPLTLGPGQRSPVRMRAESSSIGVHPVTIRVTTVSGEPVGSRTEFNVRTSNVGDVIWVIMGIGGAILALAIVVRLVRRVRSRHDPTTTPAAEPEHETAR